MTQPTNTFDSYDAIGNREDLTDIITVVAQELTPLMSKIAGTVKATARLHEWQTDDLDTAADNAKVEGDDVDRGRRATTRAIRRIGLGGRRRERRWVLGHHRGRSPLRRCGR